jgi:predicted PhzF superfamily epimerase YddE/YHI9
MNYVHVDVFSVLPYSGNSLAVFPESHGLTSAQMLRITQERVISRRYFSNPRLIRPLSALVCSI